MTTPKVSINYKPRAIPTEADWGNYRADLDENSAHSFFGGKSNEEMQAQFRSNTIGAAEGLHFMPEVPFRYYLLGYRDHIMSGNFDHGEASDAASCLLNLVTLKLEKQPRHIVPIMEDLMPAVEYVARNQSVFEADENIYGNFLEKLERIKSLYAECKDRYRRYL